MWIWFVWWHLKRCLRVLHLSLVVLEGDRMLGGLSSSGMSSIGVSKERREAWECDPASEAILSASLRASWASYTHTYNSYDLQTWVTFVSGSTTLKVWADVLPAGAESWSQALAACDQFPAVSPDTVSAALPHCDWSNSLLLCCSPGGKKDKSELEFIRTHKCSQRGQL